MNPITKEPISFPEYKAVDMQTSMKLIECLKRHSQNGFFKEDNECYTISYSEGFPYRIFKNEPLTALNFPGGIGPKNHKMIFEIAKITEFCIELEDEWWVGCTNQKIIDSYAQSDSWPEEMKFIHIESSDHLLHIATKGVAENDP